MYILYMCCDALCSFVLSRSAHDLPCTCIIIVIHVHVHVYLYLTLKKKHACSPSTCNLASLI